MVGIIYVPPSLAVKDLRFLRLRLKVISSHFAGLLFTKVQTIERQRYVNYIHCPEIDGIPSVNFLFFLFLETDQR